MKSIKGLIKKTLFGAIPDRYYLPAMYYSNSCTRKIIQEEIAVVRQLVHRRSVAVDIGANIGLYAYPLSRIFDKIVAFEPIPQCSSILKNYKAKNIEVHSVGLSSFTGVLELCIPVQNGEEIFGCASFSNSKIQSSKSIRCPVAKLDSYALTNVSFMKIDAEGHEIEVIKGGDATIKREKPLILIEIEQRHLDVPMECVFNELIGYGYRGYFIYKHQLMPLSEFSVSVHQNLLVNANDYVNNFFFSMEND